MSNDVEIRELLRQFMQAWSDGDAAAFARLFMADADFVAFSGVHLPGRDAIEAAHRTLFAGPMRGSTITGVDAAKIRFLRPDVAVVVAETGLSHAQGAGPDPGREATIATLVVVREPDAWRLAAFQNTGRSRTPASASALASD
jgi:uncharacterized protein (TIGR02246 family)